jgi:hypothetical protein
MLDPFAASICLHRLQAAFRNPAAPVEQQTGGVAGSPGHVGHDIPGYIVSLTSWIFSAVGQRRRRCTAVITSIFRFRGADVA